ncbi:MAG: hypothetical protein JYX80_00830 [Candidatus Scalindua sediminis]|nr:hypothetical protein [Candidatus Scalindua sediminis]
MTNTIREIVCARIKNLINSSEALDSLPHATTRGELREDLLVEFLGELIPSHLHIKKGLICNSEGKTTSQTDFIIYDPEILPNITLSGHVGVVPIESVYLQAEIKSTIDTKTLTQVSKQVEALHQLNIAHRSSMSTVNNIIVSTIVIGYSCNVAEETLKEWLSKSNEMPNLVAICILKEAKTLLRIGQNEVKVVKPKQGDPYYSVFVFLQKLYGLLVDIKKGRNDFEADWGQYL